MARPPGPGYELIKRGIDVVGAVFGLVLLAPLLVGFAVAIRATSAGPALFRQTRLGRHRREFTCLKYRTMHVDADDAPHRAYVRRLLTEEDAPHGGRSGVFKLDADPRVTAVGRLLRRTSLDELPQLLNVLRGEMSLVGPRPALPWEAELYRPEHLRRFEVKPGMTGLWQVSGRSTVSMREALDLDVQYVQRRSLRMDLSILARTVPAVLDLGRAR